MTQPDIREALFIAVGQAMVHHGVEGLSLRALTQSVGKSTSVIFQQFGGKEGLLRETMVAMLQRDRLFHEQLGASLDGLTPDEGLLVEIIQSYIRQRAVDVTARAWLEAVYKSRQFPDIQSLVSDWDSMRCAFWTRLLDGTRFAPLGPMLSAYLVVEEAYASALHGRMDYRLLMQETVAGLLRGCAGTHKAEDERGAAGIWLEQRAVHQAPDDFGDVPGGLDDLMKAAVRQIILTGATGLNLKRLAGDVNQAPSQIVYHFGDFATFRRRAIWRALMHALPVYLDQSGRQDVSGLPWADELALTTRPAPAEEVAGFYVTYGRTLGQTCLMGVGDRALAHFTLQLRAIEGNGIHNASHTGWDPAVRLARDTATGFALWIKGRAVLNESGAALQTAPERIVDVAHILATGRVCSHPAF